MVAQEPNRKRERERERVPSNLLFAGEEKRLETLKRQFRSNEESEEEIGGGGDHFECASYA